MWKPAIFPAAAYLLNTTWRYLPPGTVTAAVVDPGVGGERRVLAAEVDGFYFVAPDNGLLTEVLASTDAVRVFDVVRREFFLSPMSRTFHGRDVFAPVAAALARGIPIEDLGHPLEDWIKLPDTEARPEADGQIIGRVVYVDRFGNCATNIQASHLPIGPRIQIMGRRIMALSRNYSAVASGELLAIAGSSGRLEISVNGGSASAHLGTGVGAEVLVQGSEAMRL